MKHLYVVVHDDGDGIWWSRGIFDTEQEAEQIIGQVNPCMNLHDHYWINQDDGTLISDQIDAMTCIEADHIPTPGCCQILEGDYEDDRNTGGRPQEKTSSETSE